MHTCMHTRADTHTHTFIYRCLTKNWTGNNFIFPTGEKKESSFCEHESRMAFLELIISKKFPRFRNQQKKLCCYKVLGIQYVANNMYLWYCYIIPPHLFIYSIDMFVYEGEDSSIENNICAQIQNICLKCIEC